MSGIRDEYAEMSVIGAMLSDNTNADLVAARLTRNDFSNALGALYSHLQAIRAGGESFGINSAPGELQDLAQRCADRMPFANTLLLEPDIVKVENASRVRNAQNLAWQFFEECRDVEFTGNENAVAWFRGWLEQFGQALTVDGRRAPLDMRAVMAQAMASFEVYDKSKGKLLGVTTGFQNIDAITRGMRGGDTWILAARTAVGKTAVMTNMVRSAAVSGAKTLVYSYEMLPLILGQRMIYAQSNVPGMIVEKGGTNAAQFDRLYNAVSRLSSLPVWFEERGTAADIRATALTMQRTTGLDLVVVDHVGLVNSVGKSPTREREVAEISRQLKQLARDLNIPVLVLCQLNRQGERHEEPNLSDLRESGALEQDASVVIMLWAQADNAELLHYKIAKNRHGAGGKGEMKFTRETQHISEMVL